jgi:hypothetical protein
MCGRNKLTHADKARNMYTSERFRKSLEYAKTLTAEENIYILSAKHGLLELDRVIEPYDKSIYEMPITGKKEWANVVVSQLKHCTNIELDNYIFLTDDDYCKYISENIINAELPLKNLDYKEHFNWFCDKLNKKGNKS